VSACCPESSCRRTQPMMLMRSDLTGTWYVVTRWRRLPGAPETSYLAVAKHRLPDDQQAQLERLRGSDAAGDADLPG
jgi:hypothetical protein